LLQGARSANEQVNAEPKVGFGYHVDNIMAIVAFDDAEVDALGTVRPFFLFW